MRRLTTLLKAIGATGVVLALTWVVLFVAANQRLAAAKRTWIESLGPVDAAVSRHPAVRANTSACRVEELAGALGIDLRPNQVTDRPDPVAPHFPAAASRPKPSGPAPARCGGPTFGLETVNAPASRWAESQLRRGDDGIQPPPAEVAAALAAYQPQLDALCHHLVEAETPRWEEDVSRGYQAPVPNLLAILTVQRLLIADALMATLAGDAPRAALRLEASWRLNDSLRPRAELVSQAVAFAVSRMQAGLLRMVPAADPVWEERMATLDVTAPFVEALAAETWVFSKHARQVTARQRQATPWYDTALSFLVRPAYLWWEGTYRNATRTAILRIREGLPCGHRLDPTSAGLNPTFPWYDLTPKVAWPNVAALAGRAARLHLDCRLTAAVLAARAERRRDPQQRWPARPPAAILDACPGLPLTATVAPDGSLTVAIEPPYDLAGGASGLVLPMTFTVRRPPSAGSRPDQGR